MPTQQLLNRNEIIQGPSPKCLRVLRNFKADHMATYFDGYFGSLLARKISKDFNIPPEQISIGYGSEFFIRTIIDYVAHDRVTILTHNFCYTFYQKYAAFKGVRLESFKINVGEHECTFDVADCITKIKKLKPHAVIITSPNNPTGNSISVHDFIAIVDAASPKTLVVLDEAYVGFDSKYKQKTFINVLRAHGNVIILRSFSKYYALAGLRIGFALCGARVKELLNYQDLYLGGSRVLEEVAIAALDSTAYYKKLATQIVSERVRFIREVNKLKHFRAFKSDANFVMVKCDAVVRPQIYKDLATAKVVVAKFISDEFFRVTISKKKYMDGFLKKLNKYERVID